MAGALLFEQIIQICQHKYQCSQDADFPSIFLLSYPFAEMLQSDKNKCILQNQLKECFDSLAANHVSIAVIACNTLHNFLPTIPDQFIFCHLIEETGKYLEKEKLKPPLVLCTTTSANARLHQSFFPCRYPEQSIQTKIDQVIKGILEGGCLTEASQIVNSICQDEPILLGCTELSLLNEKKPLNHKKIYDPNSIVAAKICKLIFNPQENNERNLSLNEPIRF